MSKTDVSAWSQSELEAEVRRLEARMADRALPAGEASRRDVVAILAGLDEVIGRRRVDALLEEAGLDPMEIREAQARWVPWAEYERFLDAFESLAANDTGRRVGATILDTPSLRFIRLGARSLSSPETVLRWVLRIAAGPGGLAFRGCEATVTADVPGEVVVRIVPPRGGRFPLLWTELTAGVLCSVIGARDGPLLDTHRVEVIREESLVRFVVRYDPKSRMPQVLRWLRVAPADPTIEHARNELAQRNAEVHQRIEELEASERERAALQQELEDEEKMDAVGRLAGGIAHDFNNLLTAVLAQIQLLDRVPFGDAARADLANMRAAAERAATLAHRLLVVGRQQPLKIEALFIDQAIDEAQALLTSVAGEPVTVVASLEAPHTRARADATQLERALVELVLNAAEAMPEGGTIAVTTTTLEPGDPGGPVDAPFAPLVRISVRDTGSGMNAETRTRALEPYFSTRVERQGAGLGLATVHGFVRQIGGSLRVASDIGEGTEVEIFLPVVEASAS